VSRRVGQLPREAQGSEYEHRSFGEVVFTMGRFIRLLFIFIKAAFVREYHNLNLPQNYTIDRFFIY